MGLPDHISSERIYLARITEVYKSTAPGQAGEPGNSGSTGDDNLFTYDARAVDTTDVVKVTRLRPFRQIISSNLNDRPQIIAAKIGDPCWIDMNGQTPRLLSVLEQYIADDCAPEDTTPDPIDTPIQIVPKPIIPGQIDPTPIGPVSQS